MAERNRVTVDSIAGELDAARELAMRIDQPSAATAATVAKAKLHGLMIERRESGQPGEFNGLKTPEDVLAAVRAELGEAAAALLQDSMVDQPAEPERAPLATASAPDTVQ